jgi:ABC-type sugar transport system ATPase subunit
LASLCDRVAIVSQGSVVTELAAAEVSENAISRAAQGALG